jgi:hypothetical protein
MAKQDYGVEPPPALLMSNCAARIAYGFMNTGSLKSRMEPRVRTTCSTLLWEARSSIHYSWGGMFGKYLLTGQIAFERYSETACQEQSLA